MVGERRLIPTAVPCPLCSWGPQASSHHPLLSPSSTQSADPPPRPLPPPLTSQGRVCQPALAPPMVTEVFPHIQSGPRAAELALFGCQGHHLLSLLFPSCSPSSFSPGLPKCPPNSPPFRSNTSHQSSSRLMSNQPSQNASSILSLLFKSWPRKIQAPRHLSPLLWPQRRTPTSAGCWLPKGAS